MHFLSYTANFFRELLFFKLETFLGVRVYKFESSNLKITHPNAQNYIFW